MNIGLIPLPSEVDGKCGREEDETRQTGPWVRREGVNGGGKLCTESQQELLEMLAEVFILAEEIHVLGNIKAPEILEMGQCIWW